MKVKFKCKDLDIILFCVFSDSQYIDKNNWEDFINKTHLVVDTLNSEWIMLEGSPYLFPSVLFEICS